MTNPSVAPEELAPGLPGPALVFPETSSETLRKRRLPVPVWVAIVWLGLVVIGALTANILPIPNPNSSTAAGIRVGPFSNWSQPLGTDNFGRSELARLIYGARTPLIAGIGSVAIALVAALVVGTLVGYLRGRVDWIVGIITDALIAVPPLILVLAFVAILQPGLTTEIIALSLVAFPSLTRLARANAIRVSSSEYVVAARGLGATTWTIIRREIMPTVFRSVSAYAAITCSLIMLAEAALAFLGLGLPPPTADWGSMIAEAQPYLVTDPYLAFAPIVVLFLTILAINTVGDWMRGGDQAGRVI